MLVLLAWVRVIGVYAWVPLADRGCSTASPGSPPRRWPGAPRACPGGRSGWRAPGSPRGAAGRRVVRLFPWGRLAFAARDTAGNPSWPTSARPGIPRSPSSEPRSPGPCCACGTPRCGPSRAVAAAVQRLRRRLLAVGGDPAAGSPDHCGSGAGQRAGRGPGGVRRARAVLDNHVAATQGWPSGSGPARRRGRTSWSGRRTPPTSTPTPTSPPDGHRRRGRGRRRPLLMGPWWGPATSAGTTERSSGRRRACRRLLRQDPPRAVRGVHPAPLVAGPRVKALNQIPTTWSAATGRACCRSPPPGRGADVLRGRLRRAAARPRPPRRRHHRGAEQQRDVHRHRSGRAAVRDRPAAGRGDRPLRSWWSPPTASPVSSPPTVLWSSAAPPPTQG